MQDLAAAREQVAKLSEELLAAKAVAEKANCELQESCEIVEALPTGRSLKVDPGGTAETQSTFSGGGVGAGIYLEAASMTIRGPGFEIQSAFTLNLLSHGIYF